MRAEQIESVADMMKAIQAEIVAVKAGKLSEAAARVVFRGRALQLKTAELSLQYARLRRGLQPEKQVLLLSNNGKKKKK
jgi:hypothetical protein